MTRIRLSSLDTLANVFISVFFIVKFRVCEHNMPCTLQINSKDGIKQDDVESCHPTTKNISPLPKS